eukprot:TRINITY_DN5755_c0_g1_i4.p2 TRINITY_DN5755_c0_g1~~TRINITY_DN5755_c0_g1_i4.p2  ORF type:complete len:183 (-),score=53.00 TRINITY_DN5755_c0_g1_i4:89-637(-)
MREKAQKEKPSMEDAIKLAIVALKERGGSTMASILKYINANWSDMEPQALRTVARRMVKLGELVKNKRVYRVATKTLVKELKKKTEEAEKVATRTSKAKENISSTKPKRKTKALANDEESKSEAVEVKEESAKPKRRYVRRNAPRSQQEKASDVVKSKHIVLSATKKGGVKKVQRGKRSMKK